MSDYFAAWMRELEDCRNSNISPYAPEFLTWRDLRVMPIFGRCQMGGRHQLPDEMRHRIFRILGESMLIDWPVGCPGDPDPQDTQKTFSLMGRGIDALRSIFREIGVLYGSDNPRIWLVEANFEAHELLRGAK